MIRQVIVNSEEGRAAEYTARKHGSPSVIKDIHTVPIKSIIDDSKHYRVDFDNGAAVTFKKYLLEEVPATCPQTCNSIW